MKLNAITAKPDMMIHKLEAAIFFMLFSCVAFSQSAEVEKNITRFNITLIGGSITSEFKLGKHTTIFTEAGISTYARLEDEEDYVFSAHPYLQVEPRLYYSLNRRARKGKNTDYNHSGFVALTAGYIFKSLNEEAFELDKRYFIGPVWGYQVFVRNRFTFEARLGLAYLGGESSYSYPEDNQRILPITDIRFGINTE